MYISIYETDFQSRFNAGDRVLRAGALDDPEGWDGEGGGRDRMGREVGGGFRMGNTCTPMVDSC